MSQNGQSSTRKVRDVSSNTEILEITNPEIFNISPRPGGFLKVMVPTKSQDYIAVDYKPTCDVLTSSLGVSFLDTSKPSRSRKSASSMGSSVSKSHRPQDVNILISETPSREFRLNRAIVETDWDITAVDETQTVFGISNPLQDSINMLAVTISAMMLLAAKLQISEEHLLWAEEYLKCFKNHDGLYPPNIDGILMEIAKRSCECHKSSKDNIGESKSPDKESDKSPSKEAKSPEKTSKSRDKDFESPGKKSKSPSKSSSREGSPRGSRSPDKVGKRMSNSSRTSNRDPSVNTLTVASPDKRKKSGSKS